MSLTLPDFTKARLLVAGDVMLDRYWTGPTSRISPEAPVPVVRISGSEARPGGAGNVALNIAALGAKITLLGVVGRDEPARILGESLRGAGVVTEWIEAVERPTITKLRVLSRNQQVIRLDFEESLAAPGAFDRAALVARFSSLLKDVDAVVLSDYGKGTLIDVDQLIAAARLFNKPVLVDPKGSDYERYRGATLLTPNVPELEAVVSSCGDDASLVAKAEGLRERLQLDALLVTRSEKGMSLLHPGHPPLHLPTRARAVYDVTGAGDTVIATLAAALAAGEDLEHAVRLANLAASVVVAKLGTATVSPAELLSAERRRGVADGGVFDEDALVALVAEARLHSQTVVMTNGCFDILHVGHVRYLEAARQLGDVLIVAVNDDASVKRLKGDSRPLNAISDRMQLLAALKCVTWVVPFSEDTPARLIGRVLPNLLVKGGDYTPAQVAGHDAVVANGGEVVILDFHDGYSTTGLIQKVRSEKTV